MSVLYFSLSIYIFDEYENNKQMKRGKINCKIVLRQTSARKVENSNLSLSEIIGQYIFYTNLYI